MLLLGLLLLLAVPAAAMFSGPFATPRAALPTSSKVSSPPSAPASSAHAHDFGKLPLSFEPNAGQAAPEVRFTAHSSRGMLYFTPSELVLAFPATTDVAPNRGPGLSAPAPAGGRSVVRMQFLGSNPSARLVGGAQLPGKVNYMVSQDQAGWHTGLPTYSGVAYSSLYPGVDLNYEGTRDRLKGTYTVSPGADPNAIRWRYDGAEKLSIDSAGNLQVRVSAGITITEEAPVAWQESCSVRGGNVSVRYVLGPDNNVSFQIGHYDRAQALILDPALAFSSFMGGTDNDFVAGVALDGEGNIYITGDTQSTDFPTRDPFQRQNVFGYDAFIAKLNPSGTALLYSTYLGGDHNDHGRGIAVDPAGNAYIAGQTASSDFPTSPRDPFQPALNGPLDAFVAKLSPDGQDLLYSTYVGGSAVEDAGGIAIDDAGDAYITGQTASPDFPNSNAFQLLMGGAADAFVTALNPAGTSLVYSTYLGGTDNDYGRAIAIGRRVPGAQDVYVVGYTSSPNFPIRGVPYQATLRGRQDAFVTHFNAGGLLVPYSTYLGGSGDDLAAGLAVDRSGNIYLTGSTTSSDFPIAHPYQAQALGGTDAFVTRINANGRSLGYSTHLGGRRDDAGSAIAIDSGGSAYVTGFTYSDNFPAWNSLQPALRGFADAFVTRFSVSGMTVFYSSYLGGNSDETGSGIVVKAPGNAYIGGYTYSANFPVSQPLQATNQGAYDGFVADIIGANCAGEFTDVPVGSTFYPYILCLACKNILGGYTDPVNCPSGSVPCFLPGNPVTRGQLAKIVSGAAGITDPAGSPFFWDVPPDNVFYTYINRLAHRGVMTGYDDPVNCPGGRAPCFLPNNPATRGQISKIVARAADVTGDPGDPVFTDVPTDNVFYVYINRLVHRGVMSGYDNPVNCPTGAPCFRPENNATRGQVAKIVSNTFFPDCATGTDAGTPEK